MLVELPARGVRVGGVTVAPGEARAVAIALAPRARAGKQALPSIPAWVVVGQKPGPRVSVVAAVRGVEATAARAAAKLAASLDPAALTGSVVVVPVLRARGRLARANARAAGPWRFPGDATGGRGARDAFTLFSDIVIGASALIVLAGPLRARRGAVVARGRLTDPRVRRLARQSGAVAILPSPAKSHDLLAAGAAAGVPGLELSAAALPDADGVSDALAEAARATMAAVGVLGKGSERLPAPAADAEPGAGPVVAIRPVRVRADSDGFLETDVVPGAVLRARAALGRVVPALPGPSSPVLASTDGLVIEASPPGPVRAGSTLFMLLPLAEKAARRHARASKASGGQPAAAAASDAKTRVGWVEYVAFPRLGVDRLKAKIDTGARTSALHVARMRTVDTAGGPHRRPILEITVPGGGRGRRPHRVRAAVHGFAMVRDTSGRTERRPVIETAVKIGSIERRIAVTLTNRGDMLFPALIGRTALGPGVVVDPSRRYLLGRSQQRQPRESERRKS
jgi:predicted deacylase